jgi:putative methyltransferase (TIGR04325 family)
MTRSRPRAVLRDGAYWVTPPILVKAARRIYRRRPEWEYAGSAWPPAGQHRGWDVSSVVERQRKDLETRRRAALTAGLLAEDVVSHNTVMCFAYVLARAAIGRVRLSILDWGGGLGQYRALANALVPEIDLDYSCRELPRIAEAGRELMPDATFLVTDDDALERRYDLVMASSSLQYVEDWKALMTSLSTTAERWLFITRQPFVEGVPPYVAIQHPKNYGYDTSYPGWVLNRADFLTFAAGLGLTLRREMLTGEQPGIPRAPEQPVYRGFLFERTGH